MAPKNSNHITRAPSHTIEKVAGYDSPPEPQKASSSHGHHNASGLQEQRASTHEAELAIKAECNGAHVITRRTYRDPQENRATLCERRLSPPSSIYRLSLAAAVTKRLATAALPGSSRSPATDEGHLQ